MILFSSFKRIGSEGFISRRPTQTPRKLRIKKPYSLIPLKKLLLLQILAFIFVNQGELLHAQGFFCMPHEEMDQVTIAEESLQMHLGENNTKAACADLGKIIQHLANTESSYRRCGQNSIAQNLRHVADKYIARKEEECR